MPAGCLLQASLCHPSQRPQGRFAFTSVAGGEHMLCLSTNNTRWFGTPRKFVSGALPWMRLRRRHGFPQPARHTLPLRTPAQKFDLRVDVGETTIDYTEVAKKEHLSSLEVEIRRLNNKAKDIMSQQAYQREREISFRDTAESTNARVQWWSIGQTVIMIASATWQVLHLKDYFRKKKIV